MQMDALKVFSELVTVKLRKKICKGVKSAVDFNAELKLQVDKIITEI